MKTLTVTLKQHTPLIHFQHDQYGATLRVSEVKPKLDKFIIKKAFNDEWERCKEYLVGYKKSKKENADKRKEEEISLNKGLEQKFREGFRTLNYKINIAVLNGKRKEYLIASNLHKDKELPLLEKQGIKYICPTPYFAQEFENKKVIKESLKWDDIKCKGIYYNDGIELSLFSLYDTLIEQLKNHIQLFFLVNNFGSRQTKGFGSFSVIRIDGHEDHLVENEDLIKEYFDIAYKKEICNDIFFVNCDSCFNCIFETIVQDWKLLKSGIPGTDKYYAKSKLMLYGKNKMTLNDKTIRWEKKFIKDKVDNVYPKTSTENYLLKSFHKSSKGISNDECFSFLRPLLGLANRYEFLLSNPPEAAKNKKLLVEVKNNEVNRYASPMLFKVIDRTIYLLGNKENCDLIKNKEFSFKVTINKGRNSEGYSREIGTLSTPKEFFLGEFIEYAMNDNTNNKKLSYEKIVTP